MQVATIEPAQAGTQRITLNPTTGKKGLAIWGVIPIGTGLLGLALTFGGRCFEGFLVTGIAAIGTGVWMRLAFRKESWLLSPGMALRQRDFLGMKSEHQFTSVTQVLAKKHTDDDQRRILEVGLQSAQGWTRVGESLDHDDDAEAFARTLAAALGVPAEIPPRA